MSFKFQNLLGAPYKGRNVLVADNSLLLSPIKNLIFATDLTKSQTQTLPYKASSNFSRIAIFPDVVFLIAVDDTSHALFINLRHLVVLHRISFKPLVSKSSFPPMAPSSLSPSLESSSRSSNPPAFRLEFFSFHLLCTFTDFDTLNTAIDLSPDSNYILTRSKDLTAQLFWWDRSKGSELNGVLMLLYFTNEWLKEMEKTID